MLIHCSLQTIVEKKFCCYLTLKGTESSPLKSGTIFTSNPAFCTRSSHSLIRGSPSTLGGINLSSGSGGGVGDGWWSKWEGERAKEMKFARGLQLNLRPFLISKCTSCERYLVKIQGGGAVESAD